MELHLPASPPLTPASGLLGDVKHQAQEMEAGTMNTLPERLS